MLLSGFPPSPARCGSEMTALEATGKGAPKDSELFSAPEAG